MQEKWDAGDHRGKEVKQSLKEEGRQDHIMQKTGEDLKTIYAFSHLEATEDFGI